jgi:hypothetical protein
LLGGAEPLQAYVELEPEENFFRNIDKAHS